MNVKFLPLRSLKLTFLCILMAAAIAVPAQERSSASAAKNSILTAPEAAKILPPSVFFRGQSADIQARNSAGVKFSDGMLVLCTLVDTSGYSTGVQQKYQGFFMTEVPLDLGGHLLPPGAYGVGFQPGNHFVVMDIGAHDLLTAGSAHDAVLKRPTPLQILADTAPDHYRLYFGRNYVVLSRGAGR